MAEQSQTNIIQTLIPLFSYAGGLLTYLFTTWVNEKIKKRDRPDKFVDRIYDKRLEVYQNVINKLNYFTAAIVTGPLNFKELPDYKKSYGDLFGYVLNNQLIISEPLFNRLTAIITTYNKETFDANELVQDTSDAIVIMRKELGLPTIDVKLNELFSNIDKQYFLSK